MNLYAVKDTLIDYFMIPFPGPDDKSVIAALAATINSGNAHNEDIKIAPGQFELWKIATIDENGNIEKDKRLITNCARLIRTSFRQTSQPGDAETGTTNHPSEKSPPDTLRAGGTLESFTPSTMDTEAHTPPNSHT